MNKYVVECIGGRCEIMADHFVIASGGLLTLRDAGNKNRVAFPPSRWDTIWIKDDTVEFFPEEKNCDVKCCPEETSEELLEKVLFRCEKTLETLETLKTLKTLKGGLI